ncbi:GerMN domain-containing protein [Arthrobacter sp. NPDC058288]|uniref:GerMN domain-containing protein n=1 Tax=Arthrobacter sp. NPDC058288 TaxID=3346424 RepID=UPI0036F12BB0
MVITPGIRATAAAAAFLLPLWLGSCSLPVAAPENSAVGPGSMPQPQPLPAPPPATPSPDATLPASAATRPDITASAPAAKPRTGGSLTPQAGSNSAPAIDGATAVSTTGSTGTGSLAAPEQPRAGREAAPRTGLSAGTPVYFVALDDGGSTGVRFGCNDSLVAVLHSTAATEEPLRTALGVLLGGGNTPDGLYNSLHNSALDYVSAYFDGTTVVVNLTGTIRPGGTCDLPRVEAQLTHTAVSAVGAARAEIYVDGQRLADALSLR